ncbi:MAG: hypothetical protein Q8N77_04035 [Nanoarchaeota archaeon]|nr:hypothetical protein [Nanoarchaeota archaeon]
MQSDKKTYACLFRDSMKERRIRASQQIFKIKLFLEKSENSLQIAEYIKDIEPSKDLPKKLHWDYWAIIISLTIRCSMLLKPLSFQKAMRFRTMMPHRLL